MTASAGFSVDLRHKKRIEMHQNMLIEFRLKSNMPLMILNENMLQSLIANRLQTQNSPIEANNRIL